MERLAAVTLPHKTKVLFTRKRSYIAVAIISIFFIIFNAPFLVTFGIFKIPVTNMDSVSDDAVMEFPSANSLTTENGLETTINICSPNKNKFFIPYSIWTWYPMASYNVVPFLILLVSNITIITHITRATARRRMLSSHGKIKNMIYAIDVCEEIVLFF